MILFVAQVEVFLITTVADPTLTSPLIEEVVLTSVNAGTVNKSEKTSRLRNLFIIFPKINKKKDIIILYAFLYFEKQQLGKLFTHQYYF